jgi:hypothetical protein
LRVCRLATLQNKLIYLQFLEFLFKYYISLVKILFSKHWTLMIYKYRFHPRLRMCGLVPDPGGNVTSQFPICSWHAQAMRRNWRKWFVVVTMPESGTKQQ